MFRTRCKVCHKIKNISNFSNKQLLDLKHRIAGVHGDKAKSPIAEIIACRACTQGSVHEMTCCICNEPKSLDGFSKAQRKDPDNAVCRWYSIVPLNLPADLNQSGVCCASINMSLNPGPTWSRMTTKTTQARMINFPTQFRIGFLMYVRPVRHAICSTDYPRPPTGTGPMSTPPLPRSRLSTCPSMTSRTRGLGIRKRVRLLPLSPIS